MTPPEFGDSLRPFAGDFEERLVAAENPQCDAIGFGSALRACGRPPARRRARAWDGLGPRAQPRDEELAFDRAGRGIHEQLRLRRDDLIAAGDVDDAEDAAGLGVVDRHGGARPRLHETIEVLGAADLHGAIECQRRARSGGADGRLRPVRAFDEPHVPGECADAMVALHPQQAPCGIAYRDHDSRISRVARKQKRSDHVHHARERVRAAILLELLDGEVERGERLGADEVGQRPAP